MGNMRASLGRKVKEDLGDGKPCVHHALPAWARSPASEADDQVS
jgi:hypothetical protein